jgi:hypothetical protein
VYDADMIAHLLIPRPLPTVVQRLHSECKLPHKVRSRPSTEPQYMKWQNSARLRSLVPVCPHLAKPDPSSNTQALTLTILIGWTSYVISLSQAGKLSPLDALGDALKGVGKGDSALISGQRGLGVFKSIVGGEYLLMLSRNWTRAD